MPEISTNSSIEEYLAVFKDATFGEDVRDALIAAINLCYKDVVKAVWQMKKGDSITNATIQDGHLILTITDNETQESRTVDAGIVKGDKGDQGPKGDPGDTAPEHEWNVDGSFSQTSVNPVQNRVIAAKLNEIIANKLDKSAVDNSFSQSSTNPVQNRVITAKLNEIISAKVDKLSIDTDYVLISNGSGGLKNSLKKIGNSDSLHSENDSDYIALEGAVKQYTYSKDDSDNRYVQSENIDTELSTESENPVQNKVIATKFAQIENDYSAPDATIDITSTKPIQNRAVAQALNEKVDSDDFSSTIFDDIDLVFSSTNGGIYYNGNSPSQVPALFVEGAGTDPDFTYYLSYIDSLDTKIHRIANITSLVSKVIKIDTELNENSTNPVQNKVIADALNSKITVTNITGKPSSAEIAKYTDPKTLYTFYCGISGINDYVSMIFIFSGEEVDTPGGETLYPNSTQFAIAASTGKIYTRTADEDGYFGDFHDYMENYYTKDEINALLKSQ